jgi:lysophospholipase L1-like esterase
MVKKYFVFIAFGFIAIAVNGQVTNQRLFDTVPFMVDHYAKRVARFDADPIAPGSIVFLGNSITEGGRWKKLTGDSSAVNRGIGGDITFGVLKRVNEIVAAKPSKLFLLIGINDIGKDIPDAVIADNIRQIIDRFKRESPNTKVYVQSILPVNPTITNFPQHYDKNDHVKKTNEHIRNVVTQTKVTLIDTFSLFSDDQGLLKQQFTQDGLHLNNDGYSLWVNHLRKVGAL